MFTEHDARALKQALPELDFGKPAQASALLDSYLQHYGLEPDNRQAHDVHHAMGFFMCEGRRIACQYFSPQNPLATVVVLHGYYDHMGLYGHLIRYCLGRRFAVVAVDLPGHGLSDGAPAVIDSFAEYTACLEQCLQLMTQAALPRPFHAVGQSTGGSVLL